MTDFQSGCFLVSKKIAQLVKLINHLSGEITDLNFRRRFLHSQYESKLRNLTTECLESYKTQARYCDSAMQVSIESTRPLFTDHYDKLLRDFEADQVDISAQLSEFQVTMQREIAKIRSTIETITLSLKENEAEIDEMAQLVITKCREHVAKLNDQHMVDIKAVNSEADEKLNNLERQTGRKLDALDRDFNRSLEDLKAKLTGCSERSSSSKANIEQLLKMADNARDISMIMQNSRQEFDFFVSTSKAVLKELVKKKTSLCKLLKSHSASFEKDRVSIQSGTEADLISLDNQIKCLHEARDVAMSEYASETSRTKEQLDLLRATNMLDLERVRADVARLARESKKDREYLISTHKKEKEELSMNQNIEEERVRGRIAGLENDIREKSGGGEQLVRELEQIREKHAKDVAYVKSENNVQLQNFKNQLREEYHEVESMTKEQIENLPTRKLLEENRDVYQRLLEEREKCRIAITNDEGGEYELLLKELNAEKESLVKRHSHDLEQIEEEEKLILDAAMESRVEERSELMEKLQKKHDIEIQKLQDDFRSRETFRQEINDEYQKKLAGLMAELNDIRDPNSVIDGEEEVDTKELERVRKEISDKRKALIDEWLSKQKEEENRHLRTISSIVYYDREDETDKIAQEYRLRIQKLSIRVSELEQLLDECKSYKVKANLATVKSVFDREQSDLERELADLQASSKEEITNAEVSADAAKKRVAGQIHDLTTKMDRVEKVSKRHAVESKQGVLDAYDETRRRLRKLHVTKEKNIAKLSNDHQSCLDNLSSSHQSNLHSWKQQVDDQINANLSQEQALADELQKLISQQDSDAMELDANQRNHLKQMRDSLYQSLADIDTRLNALTKACNDIREKYERNEMRDEERIVIERLENQLNLKTKHVIELGKDLSSYKKQIISQEGTYNSRFGTTPNIAVLRPQTACSVGNVRRRSSRPVTATMTGMRPVSILQSRRNADPLKI